MDTGPFFSGTLVHPGGPTIKGLAVKLGDQAQAAICFDTELLRISCGWTGGFLKFSPARYGLISPPAINGIVQFGSAPIPGCTPTSRFDDTRRNRPWGPLPEEFAHYQGLSVHGRRVVLHYTIGTVKVVESPWAESSEKVTLFTREWNIAASDQEFKILLGDSRSLARLVGEAQQCAMSQVTDGNWVLTIPPRSTAVVLKAAIWNKDEKLQSDYESLLKKSPAAVDPEKWTQPGPLRWGEPLVTQGKLAAKLSDKEHAPYVIDTLTIPFENRYHALMFTSGHDFFANGDAAVCTAHGDVWLVSGIDAELKNIRWKRFATGLFQPLGLKIVKHPRDGREIVYVLGRDQITELYDFNHDGEADFYQNFNNMGQATANSHEFATCLETDSQGNFYYLRGDSGSQTQHDGCLLRVSSTGKQLDVFATGFRNANGLGIGPDDTITVAPQEGTWTPGSAIFQVKQGGFYGAMQSHHRAIPPTTFEPPICWIPRQQDNSSGGQTWVTSDRWGPLKGQLLHFSFGTCRMSLILRETFGETTQGGTVQFPLIFDSGVMRGRFRQTNGQLYVTGLKGWVSSAVQDGCFQRVRYTGQPVNMPVAMKTYSNGIGLTFATPLKKSEAQDPDNFSVEQWNYRWSGNYGSPDFKVSSPNEIGHDEVEVTSSTLLADGKTVFLEMPALTPAMQVAISYTLASDSGDPIRQTFNATLHKLGRDPQPETLVRNARSGQLPPEIEAVLKPGLILKTDYFVKHLPDSLAVTRLAAVSIFNREVDGGKPELQRLTWAGYLRVPQRAEYRFYASNQENLSVDGRAIATDVPIALGRGFHAFELRHVQTHDGGKQSPDATVKNPQVRVFWKSDGFPLESIPPTALFHRSDDAALREAQGVREGLDAFHWRGCANCHKSESNNPRDPKSVSPRREAPVFRRQMNGRIKSEWLAAWIERPHQLRSQALMPSFFHIEGKVPANDQVLADLVALLNSSGEQESGFVGKATNLPDPSLVSEGRQLYQTLGCMGCHRLTDPSIEDDYQRLSLHHVGAKFHAGAMAAFLRSPQQDYALTRMPDFQLSEREAQSLESFLRFEAKGKLAPRPDLKSGDARRGAKLFREVGCINCHALSQSRLASEIDSEREPKLSTISALGGRAKCATRATPRGQQWLPNFELDNSEARSLELYFSNQSASLFGDHVSRFLPRDITESRSLMHRLNCSACHSRDGKNSPLGEIIAEEGDGLPVESIPHLTWAGEKLRPDWIARLLRGDLKYKTRPLLKARMPAFPAYSWLGEGMAKEHGAWFVAPNASSEQNPQDAPLVELGHQLTLKTKGLDCRQCHGVGAEQPSGDKSTLISPGINFSVTAERMDFDFFPRLMMNPPRYDPSSRMPVFSVDGKTTAAKEILDGDANRQFDAIRKYLQTIPPLK
ncbi:MAG: Trehalose utilization [Planctomycetaceae bacterium]|nr:Trehalose utilization [Planctomycetaceae bacterium]